MGLAKELFFGRDVFDGIDKDLVIRYLVNFILLRPVLEICTDRLDDDYKDYNNNDNCFVTPEPLGPDGDPYPAQNAKTNPAILDKLVRDSVNYFREREACLLDG